MSEKLTGIILTGEAWDNKSHDDHIRLFTEIGSVLTSVFGQEAINVNTAYGIVSAQGKNIAEVKDLLDLAGIVDGIEIIDLSRPEPPALKRLRPIDN